MTVRATRPRIAILSEHVVNQIAAGEVVERPASVVKELLENALDAGAARIQVDLESGGAALVRVADDGAGIEPADLELAFAPHATSKVSDAADLAHVATLGFRGEALASIASVARCRMFSRPRGEPLGAEIELEGGRTLGVRAAGGGEGTRVEVRDLFFNTPARRRFLKSTPAELARALDVIQRLALAQTGVGFVATHDGKRLYDVEPAMDLAARVRRTFGAELANALAPVSAADGSTRVEGFVAPPRFARADATRQMWFLNGRPLRDKLLARVLREAYRGALEGARQPVAFLALSIDPAAVDVNVHPAKAEVRFRDDRRLFGFLAGVLREAVRATDMSTPGARMLGTAPRREAAPASDSPAFATFDLAPRAAAPPGRDPAPAFEVPALDRPSAVAECAPPPGATSAPFLRIARTYLVRALEQGFEIVDQHALHERLTFEALRREVERGRVEVQRLLVPELVEVGPASAELLVAHADSLARIGVAVERFGDGTVAVNGLPARLRRSRAEELLRGVLAVLDRTGKAPEGVELLEEALHRSACRSSVMAGDDLSDEEVRALFARAEASDYDQTCPHGRPTRVRFTLADLERAFHRR
jgi:DNA mismatch repair protein MutL